MRYKNVKKAILYDQRLIVNKHNFSEADVEAVDDYGTEQEVVEVEPAMASKQVKLHFVSQWNIDDSLTLKAVTDVEQHPHPPAPIPIVTVTNKEEKLVATSSSAFPVSCVFVDFMLFAFYQFFSFTK